MQNVTVRTVGLHGATLVFSALTGISGLAHAQQAPQPEGGATEEINLPLIDAGFFVTETYGRFGNRSETLFGNLGYTHFSVVTQRSLQGVLPPRMRFKAGESGDEEFLQFPGWVLPIWPGPHVRDWAADESDHAFVVANFLIGIPSGLGQFLTDSQEPVFAQEYGRSPDTNPVSGSGRWQGPVLGIDIGQGETHGNQILGDAAIVLTDFTDPHVDVRFSGLLDVATGRAHPDIQWTDIPVDQGAFGLEDDGAALQGRFYGPAHAEVGGTFAIESIRGAFGATRTRDAIPPNRDGPGIVVPRISFGPTDALASFGIGFDVGVRFGRGSAATARVQLDYSVWSGSIHHRGESGLSTIQLADSDAYMYWDAYRYDDTFGPLSPISFVLDWSDQWRVFSGGLATSVNPATGGATWIGAATAVDPMDPSITVRGDALVRIDDFTTPVAYVALTKLREDSTGRRRHDIYWNRIPVTRGAFHGKTAGGWIRGRFHGVRQDEVAGTFFRPSLTGAFGASRTSESISRGEVDASVPNDPQAATAFQMVGRVSGSAVPFVTSGGAGPGEVGEVVFAIADHAYGIKAFDTSLPALEWVEETRSASLDWLDTILRGELAARDELLDGDSSYTLRPLPDGNFGVLRYEKTGSGDMSLELTTGFAFGAAQFSNPFGGTATWAGEVLGFDVTDGDTSGNQIAGIATLRIGDLADPQVDVAFTGLENLQTRTAIADMTWSAVPLEAGGFRSEQSGVIEGQMYGADHSHVGGVFERDGTVGAFGATRTSGP